MKRGEFIINGIHSKELNSLIQQRPVIPAAKRKRTLKPIPGVSGDYIFDEEAYENVADTLELYTKGKTEEEILKMRNKITHVFDTGDYTDLVLYSDPDMIYQVIVTDGPNFKPDGSTPLLLPYSIGVTYKPFKQIANKGIVDATTRLELTNPTQYESKPLIRLNGTGNMKLHIDGKEFVFREIDGYVLIDSSVENAYKDVPGGIISRNHRMFTIDFPTLKPGKNVLSISGDATSFRVEPRWMIKL